MQHAQRSQGVATRFVLVGPDAGKTVVKRATATSKHGYHFVDGVFTINSVEAENVRQILAQYGAFPDGSPEYVEAQRFWEEQNGETKTPTDAGSVQQNGPGPGQGSADNRGGADEASTGDSGSVPQGDGSERAQDSVEPRDDIRDALALLDPTTDDHWNTEGKPQIKLIQQLCKDPSIKRAEIDVFEVTRENAVTS